MNFFIMKALYYCTCITEFYKELINRITIKPPPLFVYKVVRYFGVDSEEDMTVRYMSGHDIVPGDDEIIEYRFTWKRYKKYRMLRTLVYDPSPSHDALANTTTSGAKIVMAVLINLQDEIEENVLDRVCKFAGPRYDFFNNKHLQMKHMFYNDSIVPEVVLKILWSNGTLLSYDHESTLI